ncbi:MAG: OprO/OprP family phosphate-selective porin [Candidatus Brocadiaceae bacterium]|nr:OprO/OprP family phosphate-selective porin [Candidatus Brocadiaceae bacterium]
MVVGVSLMCRLEEIEKEVVSAAKKETKQAIEESRFVTKEETEQVVRDYFSTEEARNFMGVGMPDVTVKYTPDHKKSALSIATTDGRYSLNIGGRLQMRYTFKDQDSDFGEEDKQDIDVRRARLNFGGNIYSKNVHYLVEIDGDQLDVGLRDFYVSWTLTNELNTKIGYFKVPFNRQRLSSSSALILQDRSIASEFFDQDREYGVDVYGNPFEGKMEYHVAMFQGAGEDPKEFDEGKDNLDNELMYVLNMRYNPFGKYDYYDESYLSYSEKVKATIGVSVTFNAKKKDEKQEEFNNIAGVLAGLPPYKLSYQIMA